MFCSVLFGLLFALHFHYLSAGTKAEYENWLTNWQKSPRPSRDLTLFALSCALVALGGTMEWAVG